MTSPVAGFSTAELLAHISAERQRLLSEREVLRNLRRLTRRSLAAIAARLVELDEAEAVLDP